MSVQSLILDELARGKVAQISHFECMNPEQETRLREIGFAEGDEIELLHRGLFGGTPIAVRLNNALIAIARSDAKTIVLEPRS